MELLALQRVFAFWLLLFPVLLEVEQSNGAHLARYSGVCNSRSILGGCIVSVVNFLQFGQNFTRNDFCRPPEPKQHRRKLSLWSVPLLKIEFVRLPAVVRRPLAHLGVTLASLQEKCSPTTWLFQLGFLTLFPVRYIQIEDASGRRLKGWVLTFVKGREILLWVG